MGIMKNLSGLSKEEKERQHREYLEIRNRLKESQKPKPPKRKAAARKPKNGPVKTYHISELE